MEESTDLSAAQREAARKGDLKKGKGGGGLGLQNDRGKPQSLFPTPQSGLVGVSSQAGTEKASRQKSTYTPTL